MDGNADSVVYKDGVFHGKTLGGRAGISHDLNNLIHEMAHMIEIDDARVHLRGWGLTCLTVVEVMGVEYMEPVTPQATLREVRTFAIQKVISDHIGHPVDVRKDLAVLVKWLPDWCPAKYYYKANEVEGYDESERVLFDRVADDILERASRLTIEEVHQEFVRKCGVHDALVGTKVFED
tara:strand:- start:3082 stop:3618 length:537 start_codon:yes stop_codon:yes gene_type:complete